jgi:GntR family transcriptional regulator/MocR family aminotransferase
MLVPLKLVRDLPLQQQLYDQLRDLILSGRLAGGTRMPSTRMLADQFEIARITVMLTYERLIAEGLLTTLPAKGTFVAQAPSQSPKQPMRPVAIGASEPDPLTSAGRPDPRLFPTARWRAQIRTALEHLGSSMATYHPDGDPALRRAIAGWLSSSRGLATDPGHIVLTNGRQHGIHIAAHVLLDSNATAVAETPGDTRADRLLASTGASLIHVPVDEDGIQAGLLPEGPAAMALVSPEHQRPTGAKMSLERRKALIAWASRHNATIVADDVDGELRYDSMDVPPLKSLDDRGCVIHAGGFALSLGPVVQIGYLVVPSHLVAAVRVASRLFGEETGLLESAALAGLLESGAYARHLHHLRKTYLARRDALVLAMRRHFGPELDIGGGTAGLHLVWTPPRYLADPAFIVQAATQAGLEASRLDSHRVCLGFGAAAEVLIDGHVQRLARSLAAAGCRARAQTGD